jgi:hypothetical protein
MAGFPRIMSLLTGLVRVTLPPILPRLPEGDPHLQMEVTAARHNEPLQSGAGAPHESGHPIA